MAGPEYSVEMARLMWRPGQAAPAPKIRRAASDDAEYHAELARVQWRIGQLSPPAQWPGASSPSSASASHGDAGEDERNEAPPSGIRRAVFLTAVAVAYVAFSALVLAAL
jgi:hypothetical protein